MKFAVLGNTSIFLIFLYFLRETDTARTRIRIYAYLFDIPDLEVSILHTAVGTMLKPDHNHCDNCLPRQHACNLELTRAVSKIEAGKEYLIK